MNNDPLFRAIKQHAGDLQEYYLLGFKTELSSKEGERVDEILQLAEEDEFLNSLLIEIDDIIAQKQGLLNEENYKDYKDQLSWMREYLIQQQPKDREHCRRVQILLRMIGIYMGPTDGLLGSKTLAAIKMFQQQEEGLKVDGVPGNYTCEKLYRRVNHETLHKR